MGAANRGWNGTFKFFFVQAFLMLLFFSFVHVSSCASLILISSFLLQAHIHGRDFIHRDLKPQNVLLNGEGNAVICDLGTAKNMAAGALNFERMDDSQQEHDAEAPPNMTTMTGTPMYMAPETFVSASYTNAVDVWSYGVLLVRLFTLESPYPRSTTAGQLMRCVASNELRPMDVKRHLLPHPQIKEVIDGCLKFHASERLTFVDVENMLSLILEEMEEERKVTVNPLRSGGGAGDNNLLLPRNGRAENNSSVNMTLTLTRSIGHKPSNSTLMRVLSRKT